MRLSDVSARMSPFATCNDAVLTSVLIDVVGIQSLVVPQRADCARERDQGGKGGKEVGYRGGCPPSGAPREHAGRIRVESTGRCVLRVVVLEDVVNSMNG